MNKKVILIALTAVMLSAVSYAQKVITEGNALIIDCSGMDTTLYVSTIKNRVTDATIGTIGTDSTAISSMKSNKKVYKKFEVQKEDNTTTQNWKNAIIYCDSATIYGRTGWRLPTQREAILIWILKEKLMENGVAKFSIYYWSATEVDYQRAYVMNYTTQMTYSEGTKSYPINFRCIRDI